MKPWLLEVMQNDRKWAVARANSVSTPYPPDELARMMQTASVLELAVVDSGYGAPAYKQLPTETRQAAADAFAILSAIEMGSTKSDVENLLRTLCLGRIAKKDEQVEAWVEKVMAAGNWPNLPVDAKNWGGACRGHRQ